MGGVQLAGNSSLRKMFSCGEKDSFGLLLTSVSWCFGVYLIVVRGIRTFYLVTSSRHSLLFLFKIGDESFFCYFSCFACYYYCNSRLVW